MVALLFLDIDNFKTINDTLGYSFGDRLLIEIGNAVKGSMREGDTIARIGGDEFVVILSQFDSIGDVTGVACKIINLLGKTWNLIGHEIYTTVSIGIAIYPRDGYDSETLLENANAAMHKSKKMGKNNYQMYD